MLGDVRASVLTTACLAVFVTATAAGMRAPDQTTPVPVSFTRDVLPILSNNCFACHGPDDKQRMARLRFDTREGAFAKPGVIIPGDAQNSKLIKRITSKDPGFLMPPVDSGHRLTEPQIDDARLNDGAHVLDVDLQDACHARQADQHTASGRNRSA